MSLEFEVHRAMLKPELQAQFDELKTQLGWLAESFDELCELVPGIGKPAQGAEILKEMGNLFYCNKVSNEVAKEYYEQGEKLDPYNPRIQCNIGILHGEEGEFRKAVDRFRNSTDLDPSLWIAYHEWVELSFRQDPVNRTSLAEAINKFSRCMEPEQIIHLASMNDDPEFEKNYMFFISPTFLSKNLGFEDGHWVSQVIEAMTVLYSAEYPKRFDGYDTLCLLTSSVRPDLAADYDERFDGLGIASLHKAGCAPEDAGKYDKRFNAFDISYLFKNNCENEDAVKYSERFEGETIAKFILNEVSPEAANSYPETIEGKWVPYLVKGGVKPKDLGRFSPRMEDVNIAQLAKAGIAPETANPFVERFFDKDIGRNITNLDWIVEMINEGITFKDVEGYSQRFTLRDVKSFLHDSISPDTANNYKGFDSSQIARIVEGGCSQEEIESYPGRFGKEDVSWLAKFHVPPDVAAAYPKRFNGNDIVNLYPECSPELAGKYDERLEGFVIRVLARNKIYPGKADKFLERFEPAELLGIAGSFYSPDEVLEYEGRNGLQAGQLAADGCTAEIANAYGLRFDSREIISLRKENKTPEEVNKYPARFSGSGVMALIESGCPAEKAKEYDSRLSGHSVSVLHLIGINPEEMDSRQSQRFYSIFNSIVDFESGRVDDPHYKLVGTGNCGVVLLNKKTKTAWKFSKNLKEEEQLLARLKDTKNVVYLKSPIRKNCAFEINYIPGQTLGEKLFFEGGVLEREEVLSYASDVMNGLVEMRESGIWYHCDIRPGNIMIEEGTNRAVIVDLGIAKTDKNARQVDNRRFGTTVGELPNDLVSLGQVMYFMATGEHIFAQSKSMDRTFADIAQEIHDYRTDVYAGRAYRSLQSHLEDVDKKVGDERVATLIKACLTAKPYHYKKMQRMFQRYTA